MERSEGTKEEGWRQGKVTNIEVLKVDLLCVSCVYTYLSSLGRALSVNHAESGD